MATPTKKPQVTDGKLLAWSVAAIVALCVGVSLLWNHIEANPNVTVPTPVMPRPNAFDDFLAAGNALKDDKKISAAIVYPRFGSMPAGDADALASKLSLLCEVPGDGSSAGLASTG